MTTTPAEHRELTAAERDEVPNAMLPFALDLVCQVRDWNADEVKRILDPFGIDAMKALAVVLAALVPDDRTVDELAAWTHDPFRKTCPDCGRAKFPDDFAPDRSVPGGLDSICRACRETDDSVLLTRAAITTTEGTTTR